MFCRKCGKAIPDDSVFCPSCGAKVMVEIKNDSVCQADGRKRNKKTLYSVVGAICAILVVFFVSSIVYLGVIIPGAKYKNAISLLDEGHYEEAIEVFEMLNYKDSRNLLEQAIKERDYLQAIAMLEEGDYAGAGSIFNTLKGYKDVDTLLINDKKLATAALEVMFSEGNYLSFGRYPQTKEGNDQTEIEWLVLARDGQKALLISRYALDTKKYNEDYWKNTTYEKSTIRQWLTNDFMDMAFTREEQEAILVTRVKADKNPTYGKYSNPGNDTEDKVFLLSIQEAEMYFANNEARKCVPTDYAVANGASSANWLRSMGLLSDIAAFVSTSGEIDHGGSRAGSKNCIRPAMWVDINSEIFK